MTKNFILVVPLLFLFHGIFAQSESDTLVQRFRNDIKILIDTNSHIQYYVDWRFQEANDLEQNANAEQMIKVTRPYLNSAVLNAKDICFHLLANTLSKKVKDQKQKEQIVELFCQNYLNTSSDIDMVDNVLLMQKGKDFNINAKNYISSLKDSLSRSRLPNDICAKLLALAQIKESVPFLWKIVNKSISTIQRQDVDILASLARMDEKEAGIMLCNYYKSKIDRNDKYYRYVVISKNMAFSMDSTVLMLLVTELKALGPNASFWEYDSGFNASQYLGARIASMLKNYPFAKEDYNLQARQLLDWLNQTKNYELAEK
jgi:hypothetical protein